MITFKEFIAEQSAPKRIHEILNKSQMKALAKHPSFQSYIHSYEHPEVYAKEDPKFDGGPGGTRNVILTNRGNKHTMHVAITHRGKVLGHSIYKKGEVVNGRQSWDHIKTVDGK